MASARWSPCARARSRSTSATYLVAAYGWRSPIREQLGIAMHGYGRLSRSATIYFRADCAELLEGADGGPWAAAAAEAAQRVGVPIDAHVLAAGFESAYGVSSAGAALVRPDGFVAFRSPDAVDDPPKALEDALRAVLDG